MLNHVSQVVIGSSDHIFALGPPDQDILRIVLCHGHFVRVAVGLVDLYHEVVKGRLRVSPSVLALKWLNLFPQMLGSYGFDCPLLDHI